MMVRIVSKAHISLVVDETFFRYSPSSIHQARTSTQLSTIGHNLLNQFQEMNL